MPLGAGPLLQAFEAIRGARYAEHAAALNNVGGTFNELSHLNPNYFVVPGRTPEADLAALAAKHGVAIDQTGHMTRFMQPQSGEAAYLQPEMTVGGMAEDPGLPPAARSLLKQHIGAGRLNPNTLMHSIDMLGASPGTGTAKQLYAPTYERILALPDAANMSYGLSARNIAGPRAQAMTGAMEKFGDVAGNRLLIDNDQLMPLGGAMREREYGGLPTQQKIGLINVLNAQNTVQKIGALQRVLGDKAAGAPGVYQNLVDEARSLGVSDPTQLWRPSTDVDSDFYPRLAAWARGVTGTVPGATQAVGVDSLRRAGITSDVLGSGLMAQDLTGQPWLTTGIARKRGGSIPGSTPAGPLGTCHCASK